MMRRLGEAMLRSAIVQASHWRGLRGREELRVWLKVSAREFSGERFVHTIDAVLAEAGGSPASLVLELNENMLAENRDRVMRVLTDLSRLGIRIAIDEYGTGSSALSYLRRLPVHTLKIDRSFVRDIADGGQSRAIVRAIISMAHGLGMSVVADGVETSPQLESLRGEGCDAIQGPIMGEPLDAAGATTFISGSDAPNRAARANAFIARDHRHR